MSIVVKTVSTGGRTDRQMTVETVGGSIEKSFGMCIKENRITAEQNQVGGDLRMSGSRIEYGGDRYDGVL
jgi:hypothetical protein